MSITLTLDGLPRILSSTAFWSSFLVLVFAYALLASRCTTIKQRSWILTTLSSAAMSLTSVPFLALYVYTRGHLKDLPVSGVLTDNICRFFQAYLIADLSMGMLFYRSKVNLLTGWVHHTIYIFVVEYAIQGRWTHIFCLASVMELPTFVLALASIMPEFRSDVFFAVCFFVTRIAFHLALAVSLFIQRHDVTGGSYGPALIMACIFPLHAHWFSGCLKGFIKRAQADEKTVSPAKATVNTTAPQERPSTPSVPGSFSHSYAARSSILSRRRPSLRVAMRARWDQLGLWKAGGRLNEMQRRVRAALPGRERVYEYVGLDRRRFVATPIPFDLDRGLETVSEDGHPSHTS